MADTTLLPQAKSFAPSREDILSTLAFFFGDATSPEKLKDYSEQHAATCKACLASRLPKAAALLACPSLCGCVLMSCCLLCADHFPDAFAGSNLRLRDTLNNLILQVSPPATAPACTHTLEDDDARESRRMATAPKIETTLNMDPTKDGVSNDLEQSLPVHTCIHKHRVPNTTLSVPRLLRRLPQTGKPPSRCPSCVLREQSCNGMRVRPPRQLPCRRARPPCFQGLLRPLLLLLCTQSSSTCGCFSACR